MKAMFDNVKSFAVFNAKPHLFSYSQPYQLGDADKDQPVFINLISGNSAVFAARVWQFDGVVIYPESDDKAA